MAKSDSRITWEGCSVLLDINDGDRLVFARLSPNASIKLGDKKCSLKPLIGCPFGSLFRLEAGPRGPHLARCGTSSSADANRIQETDDGQSQHEVRDNRELIDNNTAQGLSSADIDAMRREGATGDEIVDALIANSLTFGKKTTFSQEKYKLKKQKKYAPKVLLRRPFARSICEAYFKKYPNRIGFLRVDTLSLLLSFGNVSAYSDVLVVDQVGGILAGAVAERLGGTGYVCNAYYGNKPPPLEIGRIFNFGNEVSSRIVQAPFSDFCSSQNNGNGSSEMHENIESLEIPSTANDMSVITKSITSGGSEHLSDVNQEESLMQDQPDETEETLSSANAGEVPMSLRRCSAGALGDSNEDNAGLVQKLVTPGKKASLENIISWKEKGFTSLIVAAPEMEVETIVPKLMPLVSYSAPFAIYHQFLQPLATCMHKLQASKMAIGLQISEPWSREYQVLPSRTHPHMQMSGFGGYILSGIKISSSEA